MHQQMNHLVKLERRIAERARRAENVLQDVATDGQVAGVVDFVGVGNWVGGTSAPTAEPVEQDPELPFTGTAFVTLLHVLLRAL